MWKNIIFKVIFSIKWNRNVTVTVTTHLCILSSWETISCKCAPSSWVCLELTITTVMTLSISRNSQEFTIIYCKTTSARAVEVQTLALHKCGLTPCVYADPRIQSTSLGMNPPASKFPQYTGVFFKGFMDRGVPEVGVWPSRRPLPNWCSSFSTRGLASEFTTWPYPRPNKVYQPFTQIAALLV